MKNSLVYISPNKRFNPEHERMIRVQIENSLDYWDKEDIILFTNFPYEYKGVKAIVAPDLYDSVSKTNPKAPSCVKVNALIYQLENGIITEEAWNHDLDAWQLAPLDVKLEKDIGVVCYGIYPPSKLHPLNGRRDFEYRINFGNVFFKPESLDILKELLCKIDKEHIYDEDGMTLLIDGGKFNDRIQIMDQTYNLGIRALKSNINIAEKPLRVAHFAPQTRWREKYRSILSNKLNKRIDEEFADICQS